MTWTYWCTITSTVCAIRVTTYIRLADWLTHTNVTRTLVSLIYCGDIASTIWAVGTITYFCLINWLIYFDMAWTMVMTWTYWYTYIPIGFQRQRILPLQHLFLTDVTSLMKYLPISLTSVHRTSSIYYLPHIADYSPLSSLHTGSLPSARFNGTTATNQCLAGYFTAWNKYCPTSKYGCNS
jgi:hypothetical protein